MTIQDMTIQDMTIQDMTIQDTIIQALEASYDAHRLALARIDMLANERPGFISRIAALETEVDHLRSHIAHFQAEDVAHLGTIQSLIAELAQAVEKTKFVLGEPRSTLTPPPVPSREGPLQPWSPTVPEEADKQAFPSEPAAELAEPADDPSDPEVEGPRLDEDERPISPETAAEAEVHLRGGLDLVAKETMWGWVQDIDNQMTQITVVIKDNGREVARTIANLYRQDLHQDGIGDGCYGYFFQFEDKFWAKGRHLLELFYLVGNTEIRAPDDKLKDLQIELECPTEEASSRL